MITACVLQDGKPCLMQFISNQFEWSAYSICELYLARWGIEVFFKEIKQTLQLADFLGTSENAIKWQIWTALLTYLLLRLNAWLSGWKRSFRRFFPLVKGVLWNQKRLSTLTASIEKRSRRLRRPSGYPPSRCSSILATSERQNKNLTKPLFQNGCPSRRNTPLNTTFLRFYGIALHHLCFLNFHGTATLLYRREVRGEINFLFLLQKKAWRREAECERFRSRALSDAAAR